MAHSAAPEARRLYTSDAADDLLCVDLGGVRGITKKTPILNTMVPAQLRYCSHYPYRY